LANITGTNGNDSLSGTSSDDSISGLDGNDTLFGLRGDDTLNGGAGADTMVGGVGDDIYFADSLDTIVEAAGVGTDRVLVIGAFALANGVDIEEIRVLTTQGTQVSGNDTAGQVLIGNFGNDVLTANAVGTTLIGDAGNDAYFVNSDDVIVETTNAGIDQVFFDPLSGAGTAFTLGANLENLLNSNGSAIASQLTGNALNNLINGSNGAEILSGLDGNDTLFGGSGNDTLEGGAGIDELFGSSNDDLLIGGGDNDFMDGGQGVDTMQGGTGNDMYNMLSDGSDVVIENANEGFDRVNASFSVTLAANVEALVMFGTDAINGTGNGLSNLMIGNAGANSISGLGGVDEIFGDDGNDTLDGGSGADSMSGGSGNDTFFIDDAGDLVFEDAGAGTDRVDASVSYTLGAAQEIEVLQLTGTGNINATGNDFAQTIAGNSGSNTIASGAANDEMFGQGGNDTFVYALGDGDDLVGDFTGAGVALGDVVVLQGTGINDLNGLLAATVDVVGGCEVTFAAGQQLSFRDVSKAQLDAGDFVFA
jgi:trimeric autotransporter adhesin